MLNRFGVKIFIKYRLSDARPLCFQKGFGVGNRSAVYSFASAFLFDLFPGPFHIAGSHHSFEQSPRLRVGTGFHPRASPLCGTFIFIGLT
jgi:hypothetical protein